MSYLLVVVVVGVAALSTNSDAGCTPPPSPPPPSTRCFLCVCASPSSTALTDAAGGEASMKSVFDVSTCRMQYLHTQVHHTHKHSYIHIHSSVHTHTCAYTPALPPRCSQTSVRIHVVCLSACSVFYVLLLVTSVASSFALPLISTLHQIYTFDFTV